MVWPTANEYFDAVQHPLRHFCKPELKRSQAVHGDDGKPLVRSGKRMDVYELRDANGQDHWAIGCFTEVPRKLASRYQLINDHLAQQPVKALEHTEYHHQGIAVRGRWYPITRSRWIDGLPLNVYVRQYLDSPDELRLLADVWVRLAQELKQAGIAHGNLASDTVFVAPGPGGALTLRLVDYDGIYVPALATVPPQEMGHADFQHWQRGELQLYDGDVDRFSQLVVLTALYALAHGGRPLWEAFDNGNNILFCGGDFKVPALSPLLRQLWQSDSSKVRALTGQLVLACHGPVSEVPDLQTLIRCLRPGAAKTALTPAQIDHINKLLDIDAERQGGNLELDEACQKTPVADAPIDCAVTDVGDTTALPVAIKAGPPPLPSAAPPPLPAAVDHPQTQTYDLEAWMPEKIAFVKLRGFVKDMGGEVVRSIPGYMRVQMLEDRDQAETPAPGFLSWLGLGQHGDRGPRVFAVIELHLVHKPTPTKQMVAITLRLTPGAENEESPRWKTFCDRTFCELRGYLMGYG